MTKTVTTRKDHSCEFCGETIPAGKEALYYEAREPRLDENETQIGIEYVRGWHCAGDCQNIDTCEEHEWVAEMEFDHYAGFWKVGAPTGREVCKKCGTRRIE